MDEIGDIPLELQAKLLRFAGAGIEGWAAPTRIASMCGGGNQSKSHNAGRRSNSEWTLLPPECVPVLIPPLRHRLEDIPTLVAHFAHRYAERMAKRIEKISPDAMRRWCDTRGPGTSGNQNFIERAAILTQGMCCTYRHCHRSRRCRTTGHPGGGGTRSRRALQKSNWVVGGARGAAARLGVKRTTLISKMRRRGLSKAMSYGG